MSAGSGTRACLPRHLRRGRVLGLLLVSLASAGTPKDLATPLSVERILVDLSDPLAVEFAPDGRMLVVERGGRIWVKPAGADHVLRRPLLQLPDMGREAGTGLLGLALAPDFSRSGHYYVLYATGAPAAYRLSRFIATANRTRAGSEQVIWTGDAAAETVGRGGRLGFGPDGTLYVALPDPEGSRSQSLRSHRGKILRLRDDGTPPADNPFTDGSGPNLDAIWAYGLRDPSFTFDSASGRMYVTDFGVDPDVRAVRKFQPGVAGANYGWPSCEGNCAAEAAGPRSPGVVYRGHGLPSAYRGAYVEVVRSGLGVRRLGLEARRGSARVFRAEAGTTRLGACPVDLEEGPDGSLYYVDCGSGADGAGASGAVYRIRDALPPSSPAMPPDPAVAGAGFALQFFGSDVNDVDKVFIPLDEPARPVDVGATDFTLEFWMRALPGENVNGGVVAGPNETWINGNIVFDRDVNGAADRGDFGVALGGQRVAFGLSAGGGFTTIVATTNVCDDAWHHVALTRRRSDGLMRIFIDGVEEASADGPDGDASYRDGRSGSPNDPYLVIGGEKHGFDGLQYRGWIDEVRISTTLRYTSNFARPTTPFAPDGNTAALYHFDEGTGTLLGDASGAVNGPSHGEVRQGGTPPGPAWVVSDAPLSAPNQPPSVSAGPDLAVTLPDLAALDGTVADDGLPSPPGAVTAGWSRLSGPGTVTFTNAAAVDTTASFSAPGTYVLRLTADDGALSSIDELTVTVSPTSRVPFLRYSDLESGPRTGGQDGAGAFVTVYGRGFASTRGSSFVTIGGGAADNYPLWRDDKIVFQLGAAAQSGNIVVHVDGAASNGLPFTVRTGNIYFVSTTGADSNPGTFAAPWNTVAHARDLMAPGDTIYLMDGVTQATEGDPIANNAALGINRGGTADRPIALVAYPGATATIGSTTLATGIRVPFLSVTDFVIAGLNLVADTSAISLQGEGVQLSSINLARWRIVGNRISCPTGEATTGCVTVWTWRDFKFLGNEVTNTGLSPASIKQYHAVYFANGYGLDLGWNWIHDNRTCHAVQLHDDEGVLYDLSVHDNLIHGDLCAGINFSTVSPSQGPVQAYNNVIWDVGNGPAPTDGTSGMGCIYVTGYYEQASGTVDVYNNTCVNAGALGFDASRGAFVRLQDAPNLFLRLRNNVVYQFGQPYLSAGSDALFQGSHNLWFGSGGGPSFLGENIDADPQFVDVAARDLHLRASSPGLDTGLANGLTRDHDSNPRDTTPDRGAYERPGSTTALRFFGSDVDGVDKVYIRLDAPPRPVDVGATDFTLEFWMKAAPGDNPNTGAVAGANESWTNGNVVFDRDVLGAPDLGEFGVSLSGERLAFGVGTPGGARTLVGVTNVGDGRWHHVAVMRRGADGAMRVFVDGTLDASGDGPDGDVSYRDGRAASADDPYLVLGGAKHGSDGRHYRGWIDEVRVSSTLRYDSSFTRPTAPFAPDASTVALYHFDEGAGSVLGDRSLAPGGPSQGEVRTGGTPPGPAWVSSDVPLYGPPNRAPQVGAGPDLAVTLPAVAILSGSVSDDGLPEPPGVVMVVWTQVSGPGPVVFGDPSLTGTTASFSIPGVYLLRLTASDGELVGSDEVAVAVAPANLPPTVNAGPDQTVVLPGTATLDGTVSDDGLPSPPGQVTVTWSQLSGPGTTTFGSATAVDTTASFSTAGTYVLRLLASDGGLMSSDDVTVTVVPPNQAPVVDAGPDRAVELPALALLDGTVTDDGLPNPPGAVTVSWSQVSGPAVVTFADAASVDTTAAFPVAGSYVLRLTGSDGELSASDELTVTVAPTNQAPVVDAGLDQAISLPALASLDGTVTDDGLPIPPGSTTVSWTQVSGPGTVSFTNAASPDTTAAFSLAGLYVLRLSASDGARATSDDVTVTVVPQNLPPAVTAEPDQTVRLDGVAVLDGTVADDGLPDPPAAITAAWSQVSGPGTATFANASAADTTARFSAAGTYVLRLMASDGASTGSDELTVTVGAGGPRPHAPVLFYSDLESGPNSGGQDGHGAFVTLYGRGFGPARRDSFVTIGGGIAQSYPVWNDGQIVVQLGPSASTGEIVTHVGGFASNGLSFTVRSGNIHFVSTDGDDSGPGSFAAPWRTVLKAKESIQEGDIAYLMDGVTQTTLDADGASLSIQSSGDPGRPKALVAYPGARVTIGSPVPSAGLHTGIRVPGTGVAVADWVLAGLHILGGVRAVDIDGMGSGSHHWRLVANTLSCPSGDGAGGCFTASHVSFLKVLGNEVTDTGARPVAQRQYHAVLLGTDTNYVEAAWNWIHDNRTCHAIEVRSEPRGPDTGYNQYAISIHDNRIQGTHCAGISFATVDPAEGRVEAYNNVIRDVGRGPAPPGGAPAAGCVYVPGETLTGPAGSGYVDVYHNTCVNAGHAGAGSIAGAFLHLGTSPDLWLRLHNNVVQQAGQPYLAPASDTATIVGSHNLWFGSGDPPAFLPDNIAADPQFVSLSAGDMHLAPTSPALDTGLFTGLGRDLDGFPRDVRPDRGAYDRVSPSTALQFFGSDVNDVDKVFIPVDGPARPADVGADDFTLEFWMRAAPGQNTNANVVEGPNESWINGNIIFDRDINGAADFGDFGLALGGQRVAFGLSANGEFRTIVGTSAVGDDAWHHVAVTRRRSDGEMRLFVDGVLEALADGPDGDVSYRDGRSSGWPNDPTLVLGGEKHGFDGLQYRGRIDEVRLSTSLRYTANFVRPSAAFINDPATAALYHLDEGTGSVAGDTSLAPGGPSDGELRVGGTPPGPAWVASEAPLSAGPANRPPSANAGEDQAVTLPGGASLQGAVSDDGLPAVPGAVLATWTRRSGPGAVTFSDASSLLTTASFSAPGTYVLRLTASDGGLTSDDDLTVEVVASTNQPPTVNAGPDQAVSLPAVASLDGTVEDDGLPNPPGSVTVAWTMESGPAAVILTAPTSPDTLASFSRAGTYVLRLSASDGALTSSDDVTVTVTGGSNVAPTVRAGPDQAVTLPASASLDGTVSDDGLPDPPGAVSTIWTQQSGPGTVAFGNAASVDTTASFSIAGTYVLRLTANDGALDSSDDVRVTVIGPNQAPSVSAGPDQSVILPAAAALDGAVSDDGLPSPPGVVTTAWTKQSGPGTVTFGNVSGVDTTASFSVAGTYVLRLTANDGVLAASADVTLTVLGPNQPPSVSAGPDQTVTLPALATLDATVSDDGLPSPPGALTTTWTKQDGPGTVTFGDASSVDTTASFSAAGTYVLRLTADDGAFAPSDDVTVTVLSANQAPTVDAGADRTVRLRRGWFGSGPRPAAPFLKGTVEDDGQPNPPGSLTLLWTMVSGPAPATFNDDSRASTRARLPVAGVYVLRLTASDGERSGSDEVTITVLPRTPFSSSGEGEGGGEAGLVVEAVLEDDFERRIRGPFGARRIATEASGAMARPTGSSGRIGDDVAKTLVKMVEAHGRRVRREGLGGARERRRVALDVGDADLVEPPGKRWVRPAHVVLFGADDQVGIVGVVGRSSIPVADIPGGPVGGAVDLSVHEDAQQARSPARERHVVPGGVGDRGGAAGGGATEEVVHAESDAPVGQRDAPVAVVAAAVYVAVQDDVAVDPAVAAARARVGAVLRSDRLDPELDGEVARAHVDGARGGVEPDDDAVEGGSGRTVAVEAQRGRVRARGKQRGGEGEHRSERHGVPPDAYILLATATRDQVVERNQACIWQFCYMDPDRRCPARGRLGDPVRGQPAIDSRRDRVTYALGPGRASALASGVDLPWSVTSKRGVS
jgi:glucose/arabinose dehydrogenase